MGKVAVTGASGFIGRRLCQRLQEEGCTVCAFLCRQSLGPWDEAISYDLGREDFPGTLLEQVDVLFHLAGKVHALDKNRADREEYQRINTEGTLRLARAAVRAGVRRFVFFSSLAAIEAAKGGDPYGKSKLEAERSLAAFADRMEIVILRPAMVYGPTTKGNLPRMIRAVARGWFPPVPDCGRRSMVHVEDVVNAAWLAATRTEAAGKTYVVTDGIEYTTRRIHEWICEALGRPAPAWTMPLPLLKGLAGVGDAIGRLRGRRFLFDSGVLEKLIGDEWYDSAEIREELGFIPARNLHDSMQEIVDYLRREDLV